LEESIMRKANVSKRQRKLSALITACAGATLASTALSATFTWDGGNVTDGNWSTAGAGGNWSGGAAPVSVNTNDLVFASNTNGLVSNNDLTPNPFIISTLTFNAGLPAFALSGVALRLSSAANDIVYNSANAVTIGNALVNAGNTTLTGTGTGDVTLNGLYTADTGIPSFTASTAGNVNLAGGITILGNNVTVTNGITAANKTLTLGGTIQPVLNVGKNLIVAGTVGSGTTTAVGALLQNNGTGVLSVKYDTNATVNVTGTANTHTGGTTIQGGAVVSVPTLANGLASSSIGASSNGATGLQFQNGTLRYTGSTSVATDRRFVINMGANNTTTYAAIEASGAGTLDFNNTNSLSYSSGALTRSAILRLGGTNTGNNILRAGLINTTGGTALEKVGVGKWILSTGGAYTGGTSITGGTLQLGLTAGPPLGTAAINSSSGITISGSDAKFLTFSNTAVTAPITVTQGTLGGTGTINTAVSIGSNAIISPGASPGTQTYSAGLTLDDNGSLLFEIDNATGVAGTNWDLLVSSGSTTLDSTNVNPFNVLLDGTAANFNNANSYNWLFLDASSTLAGFASNLFAVNTSGFTNGLGGGSFSVLRGDSVGGDNTQLFVAFTPVPEPTSVGLLLAGMGMLLRRKR